MYITGDATRRKERKPTAVQVPRKILPWRRGWRTHPGDHTQTVLPSGEENYKLLHFYFFCTRAVIIMILRFFWKSSALFRGHQWQELPKISTSNLGCLSARDIKKTVRHQHLNQPKPNSFFCERIISTFIRFSRLAVPNHAKPNMCVATLATH